MWGIRSDPSLQHPFTYDQTRPCSIPSRRAHHMTGNTVHARLHGLFHGSFFLDRTKLQVHVSAAIWMCCVVSTTLAVQWSFVKHCSEKFGVCSCK